jgi:hypothetical protein
MVKPARRRVAGWFRPVLVWSRGRDLAVGYAAVVVAVAIGLAVAPPSVAERVISSGSTNLANLRQHPPFVLVVSAFVEPTLLQLWIVAPLMWALGELQRWLGRAAVVVTVVLGHVAATLFVSTILIAGIAKDRIPFTEATATDVGVSYGLAAALGVLMARFRAVRGRYVAALSAFFMVLLMIGRSFTDLGHLVAWTIGLSVALIVTRALDADGGTDQAPPAGDRSRPVGSMVPLGDHLDDLQADQGETPELEGKRGASSQRPGQG